MKETKSITLLFILLCILNSCINSKKRIESEIDLNVLKGIADSFYQQKEFSKSLYYYTKLIVLDSTKGELFYKRGYSYSKILYMDSAIKDYSKAIDLKYRISDAYFNIGVNYSHVNDSLAIENFKKCLEFNKNDSVATKKILECENRINSK